MRCLPSSKQQATHRDNVAAGVVGRNSATTVDLRPLRRVTAKKRMAAIQIARFPGLNPAKTRPACSRGLELLPPFVRRA